MCSVVSGLRCCLLAFGVFDGLMIVVIWLGVWVFAGLCVWWLCNFVSGCGCVLMLVGRTALFAFGFICCCGFDLRDLLHG